MTRPRGYHTPKRSNVKFPECPVNGQLSKNNDRLDLAVAGPACRGAHRQHSGNFQTPAVSSPTRKLNKPAFGPIGDPLDDFFEPQNYSAISDLAGASAEM